MSVSENIPTNLKMTYHKMGYISFFNVYQTLPSTLKNELWKGHEHLRWKFLLFILDSRNCIKNL